MPTLPTGHPLPHTPTARAPRDAPEDCDALVIGAGFGGLGAGLTLAEAGARVVVCEALRYPGGCASTFTRRGVRYEAGATLFSGFAPGALFADWIARHRLAVEVDFLDPVITLRTPAWSLPVGRSRDELLARFLRFPGAPAAGLRAFFRLQGRTADLLWELLDQPELLPPWKLSALPRLLAKLPRAVGLARWVGRPLRAVLAAFGLADWEPLRVWADAFCQITIQCPAAEAEALFALATLDYCFRGTGHVRGGIGRLAFALLDAIERLGGRTLLAERVRSLERAGDAWLVTTRRHRFRARQVFANLLPQALGGLLAAPPARLAKLGARVEEGWGACMLYLVCRAPDGDPSAHHLELVVDPDAPFVAGNHLFCSMSSADDERGTPPGCRTVTISTHVDLGRLRKLSDAEQASTVAAIQERMRRGFARLAPEWAAGIVSSMPASPRTFARFTRRPEGWVGGVPRRAGLTRYPRPGPEEVAPGLFLVGDSVFPGQSTLATALGGCRAAVAGLRARQ